MWTAAAGAAWAAVPAAAANKGAARRMEGNTMKPFR